MNPVNLQLIGQNIPVTADKVSLIEGGYLLHGARLTVYLPAAPVRYLYSGWQSWSLTAWIETDRPIRPLRPRIMYSRETDPLYARAEFPNGSWYGAAELPGGQVLLLGALGLESHVSLDSRMLIGQYESGAGDWFLAAGEEEVIFARYAGLLEQRFGRGARVDALRVWCSWYSLYTEIYEDRLLKILNDLGDLPFDVFQVDDGWQVRVGDWEPNPKFPSGMDSLAARIKSTGRTAGLWLAPLLVAPSSPVYKNHPDWLLRDENHRPVSAGYNWGERMAALDTTHPAVLDWLAGLMKKVRSWGYDYIKLDFLYAGALPGKRYVDLPRETAYRNGLKVIRQALGDAYFLACGSPVVPSLGLCDGMRLGQDVADTWNSSLFDNFLANFGAPGGRNALRNVLNRLWLRPLVQPDPDVVFFSGHNGLTLEQKFLLQALAEICDFKATSDPPVWLTETERTELRRFLERRSVVCKTGRYTYQIGERTLDFEAFVQMPPRPGAMTNLFGAIIGELANIPALVNIFDRLNQHMVKKKLARNGFPD